MENWREVESVLNTVLRLPPEERESFLAGIADRNLREEVVSLLAADSDPNATATFLAAEPSPEAQIDHFRMIRELGRGGMGVVYLAKDVKLGREVALKLLPPGMQLAPERRARFEREARLAAALNHANIVTIFEVGESEGRLFIATELVRGETLPQIIARVPCCSKKPTYRAADPCGASSSPRGRRRASRPEAGECDGALRWNS